MIRIRLYYNKVCEQKTPGQKTRKSVLESSDLGYTSTRKLFLELRYFNVNKYFYYFNKPLITAIFKSYKILVLLNPDITSGFEVGNITNPRQPF